MKGKWTRREQPLSPDDKLEAIRLWDVGRDTREIAILLKIPEFQVYNGLWRWRVGLGL